MEEAHIPWHTLTHVRYILTQQNENPDVLSGRTTLQYQLGQSLWFTNLGKCSPPKNTTVKFDPITGKKKTLDIISYM